LGFSNKFSSVNYTLARQQSVAEEELRGDRESRCSDLQDAAGGRVCMGNFSVGVGTIGIFSFSSYADNLAVVESVIFLVLRGRMGNQMM
jgi:hypothetical protein